MSFTRSERVFDTLPNICSLSSRAVSIPNNLASVSDRFGYGVPRAFAFVTREGASAPELLVFDHPDTSTQVPKGRIDPGEPPSQAAIRELEEESGLLLEAPVHLKTVTRRFTPPESSDVVNETWHLFRFEAPDGLPETWVHHAVDEDMEYAYRWVPIDPDLPGRLHPYFSDLAQYVWSALA